MSALQDLLGQFRATAQSEREKGTYFERLVQTYLQAEPKFRDQYEGRVWLWEEWRPEAIMRGLGDPGPDAGIDLVAETTTGELHAIQAKFYAENRKLTLEDLATFFTASGKKHFARRLVFLTTSRGTSHLNRALNDQQPPVTLIDLWGLEGSLIDWSRYQPGEAPALRERKRLRPHQQAALDAVVQRLATGGRGKLVMACGTGKTFTSLKIAERLAGKGGRVLFLVPSLALLSQTLTEWTQESAIPLHSFAVCSDNRVGKKAGDDDFAMLTHELQYPATTSAAALAREAASRADGEHMQVVFATYHSIDVLNEAQALGMADFDLIIGDEAHRTTGATFAGDDESHFVKVHDNGFLHSRRRLYMTATPRVYGNAAKAKAEQQSVALASMDDEALYGPTLHTLNFSEAVKRDLLVDYKVIVLAMEEAHISRRLQGLLKDEDNQLKVDDAAKIVGCWKALAKQGLRESLPDDGGPMQRAVAFCQVIEPRPGGRTHKVASKEIARMFSAVVEAYRETAPGDEVAASLACEARHVDGSMNAGEKDERLAWLRDAPPEDTCRILSNVRCLSEGVDVPALDAVLFLTARNSQVDVVQSVGRVMRKSPGKTRGYIILPVVIPAGTEPHEALNDNKTYKVVWDVLNALRSHDDRFDAMVNKMELVGPDLARMEVLAITDHLPGRPGRDEGKTDAPAGRGQHNIGGAERRPDAAKDQAELAFEITDVERAIYARLVEKVGNRHHWEDWADDIAKIANTHIDRIRGILENPANTRERATFAAFAAEIRDDLNDSITDEDVIKMLAQHLITRPVFEALFAGHAFARNNPMSEALQTVLDALQQHHIGKEADTLQGFYDSVKMRAEGITGTGRQKIIVELYDKFFRKAFPRVTAQLGIVYTPVEVVDFIILSVNEALRDNFGETLGSKGVHILDPFTGTGTFISRLLQSGLITKTQLPHKYAHEIHANEIMLLAYYIAAINIEAVYHDLTGGDYQPFAGICLTDTFQMYEAPDMVSALLEDNSERRKRQKALDIRVIMGNPPYSVGQESANDNAQNVLYPHLNSRIRDTYAARSTATNKNALYDSYIRAIRWASDRIGDRGVIGFVTNAGWVDSSTADGMRKTLAEEFSSIHIFHLRGNQRTSGERSRREGGKIFGGGSRAPIAISLLVKNPDASAQGQIFFHDIGDYLSQEEKLQSIAGFGSTAGIARARGWRKIIPDEHGDWLNQRDDRFADFLVLGDKKGNEPALFANYSAGVKTQRDAWAYNPSQRALAENMQAMIEFYNGEVRRFQAAGAPRDELGSFVSTDPSKISWTRALRGDLSRGKTFAFDGACLAPGLYRPFTRQWLYYNRTFNEMVYQMPRIFPLGEEAANRVIMVKQRPPEGSQLALMVDTIPELQTDGGSQCFPEYLYTEGAEIAEQNRTEQNRTEQNRTIITKTDDRARAKSGDLHLGRGAETRLQRADDERHPQPAHGGYRRQPMLSAVPLREGGRGMTDPQPGLFDAQPAPSGLVRRDGITDAGLAHFQQAYPGEAISKQDIFYYVYGLLHSEDYRTRFADNLAKELPRIPRVKTAADFWAFANAGRALAGLHVNYEQVAPYPVTFAQGDLRLVDIADPVRFYRVEKMRFGGKRPDLDKSIVHYNPHITITDIPLAAYDYVVNGKPALEWVMERQCVKVDRKSGIESDANRYATETMGDPAYPLLLFQRIITVSLETMKIVRALPPLGDELS